MSQLGAIAPEDLAAELGWGVKRLRRLAKQLGACRILGNRMALLPEDVKMIMEGENMDGTDSKRDTQGARGRSGPVRYEVVDKDGNIHGSWDTAGRAFNFATKAWPDQEQDEDRTGKGWDVQVVGCDQ